MTSTRIPLHAWLLLLGPRRIDAQLNRVAAAGWPTPNRWQIELGVLRMWHRTLFRSNTIGTCTEHPVRQTWRARLMQWRPVRFPFLLTERAVAPWDMSGLYSSRERLIRHLLGAHHDAHQFIYDVQMLSLQPGALDELRRRATAVVDGTDPRSEWLKDLCVFEGYHESLLAGLNRFIQGEQQLSEADTQDPDISFLAYLRWCAQQPKTLGETWAAWRTGDFDLPGGRT